VSRNCFELLGAPPPLDPAQAAVDDGWPSSPGSAILFAAENDWTRN